MNRLILLLFFLGITLPGLSQRIKYKDLYPLLETQQFEIAKPLLYQFLQDEDDHPNGHFQMAIIYTEQLEDIHPIEDRNAFMQDADSAIFFYQRAYELIDDRELRRNDEYYQAYNRRDMRTGKFDIKLSDVQLDIEQRIEMLQERKKVADEMGGLWAEGERLYNALTTRLNTLEDRYDNQKGLILNSPEDITNDMERIAIRFDSALSFFDRLADDYTKFSYELNTMEDLQHDRELLDVYEDNINLVNYKEWAEASAQQKVDLQNAISNMRVWLEDQSVDISNTLTVLQPYDDQRFFPMLKKFLEVDLSYIDVFKWNETDSIELKKALDSLKWMDESMENQRKLIGEFEKIDFEQVEKDFPGLTEGLRTRLETKRKQISNTEEGLRELIELVEYRSSYLADEADTLYLDSYTFIFTDTIDNLFISLSSLKIPDLNSTAITTPAEEDTLTAVNENGQPVDSTATAAADSLQTPVSVGETYELIYHNAYGVLLGRDTITYDQSSDIPISTESLSCHVSTYYMMKRVKQYFILHLGEGLAAPDWVVSLPLSGEIRPQISCLGESLIVADKDNIYRITNEGEITE